MLWIGTAVTLIAGLVALAAVLVVLLTLVSLGP
jgi:hypothetical protein